MLTVKDFGMGVPREVPDHFWKTGNAGVGLAGIRERLKESGGALAIELSLDGTLLSATIPHYATDGLDPDDGVPYPLGKHTVDGGREASLEIVRTVSASGSKQWV